ncbi:uncharacterized protein LOC143263265 [Megalopta genalis]|uniref:uncharacterized protein LOC117225707 n=1 Tax=Megalopta genalis TaxID=115081 RepID=UPI001443486C|nr:uncharacterized protein LOC117225707 [Megalopta genalis]
MDSSVNDATMTMELTGSVKLKLVLNFPERRPDAFTNARSLGENRSTSKYDTCSDNSISAMTISGKQVLQGRASGMFFSEFVTSLSQELRNSDTPDRSPRNPLPERPRGKIKARDPIHKLQSHKSTQTE